MPVPGQARLSHRSHCEHHGEDLVLTVGLKGKYGSHTLRKTWGYWQRMERGTAVPLLMEASGHATQQQTLGYLGIQAEEIAQIYELEL